MIFATCTFCDRISADDYWVVASLTNQQAALREVSRLSTETGMIIELSMFSKAGNEYHRLLIAARDMDEGLQHGSDGETLLRGFSAKHICAGRNHLAKWKSD